MSSDLTEHWVSMEISSRVVRAGTDVSRLLCMVDVSGAAHDARELLVQLGD